MIETESKAEKPVRGSCLTTVNRMLSKKTLLVCDGMNYIKGYRYQMNCAAKEAGVRPCTVSLPVVSQGKQDLNCFTLLRFT